MCENIQNCCRICLDTNSEHVSILGDLIINLHLKTCLSITVSPNDHLPKSICRHCVSQLSQFYNFLLNARCAQDWLESSIQEMTKKSVEIKAPLQPLPDSEYNSDSLLEFLNNTANIEDYLNSLGKEDIPSIVNMLDKNEHNFDPTKILCNLKGKQPSPMKKELKSKNIAMEIDVLDSDVEIVKEIIMKEVDPKNKVQVVKGDKNFNTCYGCKLKFDGIQRVGQHVSTCDYASRTCLHCDTLFDSRLKMIEHSTSHNTSQPNYCYCGEKFLNKHSLTNHQKMCRAEYGVRLGCTFKCKECGDAFKDRFQLYRHARRHIMISEDRKCDICGHLFTSHDALLKHKKKEHDKSEDTMYRCKVCKLTLPDHKDMYQHVKTHTIKPEPARHLCESCGKSFTTLAILTRHSLIHNKDFSCLICGKNFDGKKNKDKHMIEHNDVTMCERCGQTVNSHKLESHVCI